jgi:8-oxo-dGTP pyrophosphatase MutT (NUDIX family)
VDGATSSQIGLLNRSHDSRPNTLDDAPAAAVARRAGVPVKPVRRAGIQYAALPWRIVGRQVQVLLITSRGTGRWVIPKGWPMRGMKPQDAAAMEASEEAGLVGVVDDAPIGAYHYLKQFKNAPDLPVEVVVYPFEVRYQADDWKEQGQRQLEWRPYRQAALMVAEPALRRLIVEFGAGRSPGFLSRLRRSRRGAPRPGPDRRPTP